MVCKLFKPILFLVILVGVGLNNGYSAWVCIDTNAPISASTGDIAAPTQIVANTGTEYVRVNFILGPWTSPSDATKRGSQQKSWFETYDIIIDGFVSRGVKVYGLIGAEAVHSSSSNLNSDEYIADYVSNFVQIVEHFKDRIRVYESFNEPNDWAGGTTSQVQPLYFAKMLEQIYRAIKIDNGHSSDPSWQVTLVSGPLFSHDMDTVAPYFSQVYSNGINNLGWTDVKNLTGSYPLDGIGYHIYIAQGATDEPTIKNKMDENLNAIWNTITSYEGTSTPKKLWISEFGWRVSYVGTEAAQANNLEMSFGILLPDKRIQLATWFCLKDFDGDGYGIFRQSGTTDADKKQSWFSFNKIALANRSPYNASFVSNNLPKEMPANQTRAIAITVKNTGSLKWDGIGEVNPIKFMTANSNAQTTLQNQFVWSNFANGGYYTSFTDAQAYLSGSLTLGEETDIIFSIKSPDKSGAFSFSGKMYNSDTSTFFGDSLEGYILVQKGNDNSLFNPGFEIGNLTGWESFGENDGVIKGSWFGSVAPQNGDYFLGSASNYGQKNGGIFQQINAISESTYGARAFVRTYTEGTGESSCRIGIDPKGGKDNSASSIVWSQWISSSGQWTPVYVYAKPQSAKITLFLEGRQTATVWNVTAFDNCLFLPMISSEENLFILH